MALYKNEDAVWQEFVADVFAGMNDYADDFVDVVADYAKGDKAIDSYNAAEYNEIMDAGGNDAVLDNIGFGDESYIAYSIAKWHPDLSRQRLEILDNEIKKDSKTGKNYITDTAKWLYEEDIDGINVLAIYSIEDSEGPTLLYESKGKKAKFEKRILELLSEEYNYGRSNDRQSKNLNEILSGSRLQQGYSVQNSADIMGRGSGNGNAEILQGSSRRNPSRAFRNVIENLFEIQDENRNNSGDGRGIGKYPKEKD